ncbi:MAG TPA: NrfD/PsrC family molybdoenzyme membrane anchor subunit [Tepidisphaeraceae bacterium]|jgi:molybdopterin-containing oxidoreductase family membrane subunit
MSGHAAEIPNSETTLVLAPGHTYASVTDKIADLVLTRPFTLTWFVVVGFTGLFVCMLMLAVSYLFARGVGIWGVNVPVAWGFAIVNFVWWIGIGHAGTFISAMLLLMRQDWRTSINRFAEAMTLFAVACAGMFPLLHLGRPWKFYYLLPYPNTMWLWPQFRSALVWDVFAVSTYFTVSLIFWYVGLIPDLATLRDQASNKTVARIYGVLALGWRGAASHWRRYHSAYLLLGGLAAPLVVSVHSVVSMDFAEAQVPGWHTTIFPPYFVAGAIFSGFAMVLTLAIPMRSIFRLKDMITLQHIDNCAKLLLVTGLIVAYGYSMEYFMGWYSGEPTERYLNANRALGPYAWTWWTIVFCNVVTPQALWFRWVRRNVWLMFLISLVIQVGMWGERFVIVIISLHRDFLPSSWGMYYPTRWDWAVLLGTIGFFLFCFILFARLLPVISISEMRELVHSSHKSDAEAAG